MTLERILDNSGVDYKKGSKPGEIWLCCPFCTDERHRLGVNVITGKAHCFNCEWASRDRSYIFRQLNLAIDGGDFEEEKVPKKKHRVKLPGDFQAIEKNSDDYWAKEAADYVHRVRRVSWRQIRDKHIGYSTVGDYAYRVIVPIFCAGKFTGFVGRALRSSMSPPYKNSKGDKGLYNLPEDKSYGVVLCEGVFDALAVERGCPIGYDSCAVLGHSLTDKQLAMLEGYRKVILWPDNDKPGIIDGALKIANQIRSELHVCGSTPEIRIIIPKANDPDPSDFYPDEVDRRIRNAAEFTESLEMKLRHKWATQE